MLSLILRGLQWFTGLLICGLSLSIMAASLSDTIAVVKPSVVGVGTYLPTRQPRSQLMGTGFVVGNGSYIVTNAHVIGGELDILHKERRVIFVGVGKTPEVVDVELVRRDNEHDLALLKLSSGKLPALQLGDSSTVREGEEYAFTGFPVGAVLGLYPATHHGIIASITPMAIPAFYSGQLDPRLIRRLQSPYSIFQLDATAYPGNSGSPLYDPATGKVIGVINKVFVKETKESVLEKPSGITYAIPSNYVRDLVKSQQ
ncbi:MAG: trypsin-like peptidase domain-containing protein [Pseudomonadales bacterium]|nr:trypsin-like peptidase domain-containing protein [Pseudomonadales bacterium]MCP5302902.1 trypsin-like peptidase domain-containing protein [Pseudomonadales bacterium]